MRNKAFFLSLLSTKKTGTIYDIQNSQILPCTVKIKFLSNKILENICTCPTQYSEHSQYRILIKKICIVDFLCDAWFPVILFHRHTNMFLKHTALHFAHPNTFAHTKCLEATQKTWRNVNTNDECLEGEWEWQRCAWSPVPLVYSACC